MAAWQPAPLAYIWPVKYLWIDFQVQKYYESPATQREPATAGQLLVWSQVSIPRRWRLASALVMAIALLFRRVSLHDCDKAIPVARPSDVPCPNTLLL